MTLPKEFLSPKKRGRSSSSSLPQAFEIGKSSRKTSIERHEEQIKEILNHLEDVTPPNSLQRKTGFGIVTSWREEDLIREIDLYMLIYQCILHTFHTIEHLRKTLLKCQHKV
ncbi:hypothetical protein Tco_0218460, partial [Tanacetum coccineum]